MVRGIHLAGQHANRDLHTGPGQCCQPAAGVLRPCGPSGHAEGRGGSQWNRKLDVAGRAVRHDCAGHQPEGTGGFTQNLRFPGQYAGQESGLFYNYFRNYDASVGRYIQSDPIGLIGGLNTYGYASSSPSMYIDGFGLAYILPGEHGHGGVVDFGEKIDAYIYDMPDGESYASKQRRPAEADIDFIYTDGQWYKIKTGDVRARRDPRNFCKTIIEPFGKNSMAVFYPVNNIPTFWQWANGTEPQRHINSLVVTLDNPNGFSVPVPPSRSWWRKP